MRKGDSNICLLSRTRRVFSAVWGSGWQVFKNLSSNLFCQRDQRHIGQPLECVRRSSRICISGGRATSWRRGKMDNAYFSQLLGMASEKQKAKTATSGSSSKFISTKVWPHILFIYVLTAFLYYWRCLSVFFVPP